MLFKKFPDIIIFVACCTSIIVLFRSVDIKGKYYESLTLLVVVRYDIHYMGGFTKIDFKSMNGGGVRKSGSKKRFNLKRHKKALSIMGAVVVFLVLFAIFGVALPA